MSTESPRPQLKADWGSALLIFVIGILLPAAVAVVRWIAIGLANAPFFAQRPTNPLDPSDDVTLKITAVLMTAAVAGLIVITVIAATRQRNIVAAVILLIPSIGLMVLNWYVVLA
ncbi:hypothetical protein [Agromyces sp. NPDC058126]|uniref:hypothetical protein n=1 Tax=Agromyces sp. NPDC058126 TaxID=3346350 RepID=UPI0036DBA6F9